MKKIYNKLVRDKIPEIIRNDNKICKIKMLNEQDYILELKQKLCEEAKEVLNADSKTKVAEELADVLEIIDALKDVYNFTNQDIQYIKEKKANKNGRFKEKIYLEYVIEE